MFNVQGSEIIIIVLVALIVLGPEKLPDAIRKVSKAYAEIRKVSNGFQSELRSALDEPMRELRDTADLVRKNADFRDLVGSSASTPTTKPVTPVTPAAVTDDAPARNSPPTAPAPGLDPVVAAEQADRQNDAEADNDTVGSSDVTEEPESEDPPR